MREIGLLGPGKTAKLRIWRERTGQELRLPVKLAKWPAPVSNDYRIIATNYRFPPWRGVVVDFPTGRAEFIEDTLALTIPHAVAVSKILKKSRAELLELKQGDFITHVNKTPVQTPAEFHDAVTPLTGDVTLRLLDDRRIVVRK